MIHTFLSVVSFMVNFSKNLLLSIVKLRKILESMLYTTDMLIKHRRSFSNSVSKTSAKCSGLKPEVRKNKIPFKNEKKTAIIDKSLFLFP